MCDWSVRCGTTDLLCLCFNERRFQVMSTVIQYILYLAVLVVLAIPLGAYIKKVMNGEKTFLSKILTPCENAVYKVMKVNKEEQMNWKKYAASVLIFSGIGLVFLFLLQLLQGVLPGNPQGLSGVKWDLSFNTAVSFITNTNWQAYSGESTLSYLTQALGLTVQNFVSAATGIAVLFALIRGFIKVKADGLGSFWVDMTRIVIHILLPLNLVISLLLVGGGVVQNLKGAETVSLVEPIAVSADGTILENAQINLETETVTVDGQVIEDAEIVTEQFVPMGPAASQVAIKQTGTNGGGFNGVNSAHPLENPNAFTNIIEMISLLLIPAALCFTFGSAVKNKKQGIAIFMAMFICLALALGTIAVSEQLATPQLAQDGNVNISMTDQAGGNMEGKETRFGIASSSTWAAFTTAASNGSVNSMHDSYTPLGGMVTMLLMQLGEVIFGGVGCGLYGMLAFAILTVFIAGLMVGRTPEFLGKKIEPYEMKWSVLVCLATPIAILVGSGIAAIVPSVTDSLNNGGAHGFSELLYAYSSCGGNNGSAFAGFNANTVFLNISLGLVMLFARFLPIIGTLAIAGSLAGKKKIATTAGTLSTTNAMFVFLLIFIVLLVGALSFFPALALGPIAEFFQSIV
jgi:K+-transporting ATPase ATPase A chain